MYKIVSLLLVLSICTSLTAQNSLPIRIGNMINFKKTETGANISAENAEVQLQVFSPNIIRVFITKNTYYNDFSYAVVPKAQGGFTEIKEGKDQWILKTDSVMVKVQTTPISISFYNLKGEILNEDEPAFGVNWMGTEVTCYKKLQPGEKFIGLGEKTGDLNRAGNAYENWNTDDYGYEANADPLYVTTPFYIGLHGRRMYGIFFDNSYKSTFNFGASNDRFSFFSAVDGNMDYYFINGGSIPQILKEYTYLTGRMEMPPLWSLGFQQCRWSYFPDKEVVTLAKTFRDKNIGGDVIYLDINYMDAYKIFTFHPKDFPNPKQTIDELKKLGFHVVVIVDPGIKVEKGYEAFDDGVQKNMFLKYPDGTFYTGQVWPGWCHFPDFTSPETRTWWGSKFKAYTDVGIEGFWNDMNEPATWGQNFPNMVLFNKDNHTTTHRETHNLYGFQMARSTYEGAKKLLNGKRTFALTRAAYSGIQRYSAVWTGDNVATDEHMLSGIRLLNSMGLAGIPFVGCDVGGFSGNATQDLYLRWLSIGAFTPFFRAHSQINSTDHEPWAWGEQVEGEARKIIAQRYRLIPYLYGTFYEAHTTGLPVQRSLAIGYPFDEKVYYYQYGNQFMLGNAFLIAPVESNQKYQKVYLPEGKWYRWDSETAYTGNQEVIVEADLAHLPVFVKGSSFVPVQSPTLSTMFPASQTLEMHLYYGDTNVEYTYYEDDGETYEYEKEAFCKRKFTFQPQEKFFRAAECEGRFESKFKNITYILHGFPSNLSLSFGKPIRITYNAEQRTHSFTTSWGESGSWKWE